MAANALVSSWFVYCYSLSRTLIYLEPHKLQCIQDRTTRYAHTNPVKNLKRLLFEQHSAFKIRILVLNLFQFGYFTYLSPLKKNRNSVSNTMRGQKDGKILKIKTNRSEIYRSVHK